MSKDPIHGTTLRFTFDDGPMANKAFEHHFGERGTVTFRMVEADDAVDVDRGKRSQAADEKSAETRYETAAIREDVWAVSYLSSRGYTLTAVLDFKTKKLVAFSSNEKMLAMQKGTFVEADAAARARQKS
jgi:molybdenum cofactor biosynthesis protein MoaF